MTFLLRSRNKPVSPLFVIPVILLLISGTGYSQDSGGPKWGEWLSRRMRRDPLLKKPFMEHGEDEVKGLASKLRARELDIPNRTRALNYLSTFHCATFPEAREMLVKVLLTDKWEPVRYEAAKALRDMFANCACTSSCGEDAEKEKELSKREKEEALRRGAPDADAPRNCTCCCDSETLNKLAKVAYEMKDDGCCFEPSRRVREMAVEAIKACGVPCHYRPYMQHEEFGPPVFDEVEKTMEDDGTKEKIPTPQLEAIPTSVSNTRILRSVVTQPQPIAALSDFCIVSLKQGAKVKPSPLHSANFRGRLYFFASEAAKAEFCESPEDYAVAFGGCDPVHYVQTYEAVEGHYLVLHENRFYMFASESNYERFKKNIDRYAPRESKSAAAIAQKENNETHESVEVAVADAPAFLPPTSREELAQRSVATVAVPAAQNRHVQEDQHDEAVVVESNEVEASQVFFLPPAPEEFVEINAVPISQRNNVEGRRRGEVISADSVEPEDTQVFLPPAPEEFEGNNVTSTLTLKKPQTELVNYRVQKEEPQTFLLPPLPENNN